MGVNYNPNLSADGLVTVIDFANPKSYSVNVHPYPNNIGRWMSVNSGGTSNCIISEDPTQISPTGGIPMRMITTGADPHLISYQVSKWNLAPANTGETWTASVWVRANTAVTIEGIPIFGANSTGVWASGLGFDAGGFGSFSVDTNWRRISTTLTMNNANTRFIQVRLDGPNTFTPATIWWDGLQVEKSSSASNFNPRTNINGNTVIDIVGSNNLSIEGNPTIDSRGFLTFANNQTTQYLYRPTFSIPTDNHTISVWFRVNNFGDAGQTIFSYSSPFSDTNYLLVITSTFQSIQIYRTGANNNTYTVSDMRNRWNQFTRTRVRSTGLEIYYLNAIEIGNTFVDINGSTQSGGYLVLGQEQDAVGGSFDSAQNLDGSLSQMLIYNRVLSPAELLQNYNATKSRYGL